MPSALAARANAAEAANDSEVDIHINRHATVDDTAAKITPAVSNRETSWRVRGLFATDTSESMRPRMSTLAATREEKQMGLTTRYNAYMGKLLINKYRQVVASLHCPNISLEVAGERRCFGGRHKIRIFAQQIPRQEQSAFYSHRDETGYHKQKVMDLPGPTTIAW